MGEGEEGGILGQKTSDFHYQLIYAIFNVIEFFEFTWTTKPKHFKYPERAVCVLLVQVTRLIYIILSFS